MIPVIFRQFKKGGEVIAIFPTIPATMHPWECESYMHVGQHGACNPAHLINNLTVPAKGPEVPMLFMELVRIGYVGLHAYKRRQPKHQQELFSALKEMS